MKDFLKLCFIFVAVILFIAATNQQPTVVKPKQTVVKSFRTMAYIENEITTYINEMTAKGYVVKSVAMSEDEDRAKAIVVLELY